MVRSESTTSPSRSRGLKPVLVVGLVVAIVYGFQWSYVYSPERDRLLRSHGSAQADLRKAQYAAELEAALAKHENAEEPDGAAMIGDVKKVRDDYRKELQTILSKEQYEGYLAMVEAVLLEMMSDVAEIRLMDIQPKCSLTDEQVVELAPIMGKGMFDMVRLLFENADQRMSMPKKVKLGKAVKSIQSDMDKQINAVLTEEQQKAYAAYKEAQKG